MRFESQGSSAGQANTIAEENRSSAAAEIGAAGGQRFALAFGRDLVEQRLNRGAHGCGERRRGSARPLVRCASRCLVTTTIHFKLSFPRTMRKTGRKCDFQRKCG